MQIVRYHDGERFRIAVPVRAARTKQKVLVVDSVKKRDGHRVCLKLKTLPLDERFIPADYGKREERKMRASLRRLARKSGAKMQAIVAEVAA